MTESVVQTEPDMKVLFSAEKIAAKRRPEVQPHAFTAGLLHDVGKVLLGTFVDVDDAPIKELVELDNLTFNEAERMVLGVDHAEVEIVDDGIGRFVGRQDVPDHGLHLVIGVKNLRVLVTANLFVMTLR